MTDYYPRLVRAVEAQELPPTSVRTAIYAHARDALLKALKGIRPPVPDAVIVTEENDFDAAVARVEADVRRRLAPWERESGPFAPTRISTSRYPQPASVAEDLTEPLTTAAITSDEPSAPPSPSDTPEAAASPQEKPMSRLDELNKILRKLQSDSPGLEASALISEDGLMIASALTPDLEENRVAGMTATLLNLGTRAAVELARGEVHEVIIRGDRGYAVMIDAGRGALLLALANESAKLGLIFFDMHEAIRALKKVL